MSEPSHLQLRWQWLLVADEAWWVQAAGGKLSVIPKVGFNPTVCEAVYLKYMDNVPGLSREVLWLVLSYFKHFKVPMMTGTRTSRRVRRCGASFVALFPW